MKKKSLNKLVDTLTNDSYRADGKTTFKEEFVTSGGVALKDVSFETMESRVCSGMYFAEEVLDIDAVTGGFNFQAAWTTGFSGGVDDRFYRRQIARQWLTMFKRVRNRRK